MRVYKGKCWCVFAWLHRCNILLHNGDKLFIHPQQSHAFTVCSMRRPMTQQHVGTEHDISSRISSETGSHCTQLWANTVCCLWKWSKRTQIVRSNTVYLLTRAATVWEAAFREDEAGRETKTGAEKVRRRVWGRETGCCVQQKPIKSGLLRTRCHCFHFLATKQNSKWE